MRRSDSLFSGISASSVIALALVSLLFLFQTAKAEPVRDGAVAAELLAEDGAIVPGKPFTVGLKLEIDPGWHTYWKNPGDSGLATKIEWQLPEGFSAGPIQFPTPHRFEVDFGGIKQVGLGYTHDEVPLHLIQITPPAQLETGEEITLSGKATWLMCDDHQCVPGGVDLSLALPVANGTPPPGQPPAYGTPAAGSAPAYGAPVGAPLSPQEEKGWSLAAHLLVLVAGFLAPLIIWLVFKGRSPFLEHHAKESLNFQITVTIAAIVSVLAMFLLVGFVMIIVLIPWMLVMPILAAVKANNGEWYRYPLTLRLIT